jgi:hypothetical protein
MYQLQTDVKEFPLHFIPKEKTEAFIKAILSAYKRIYTVMSKVSGVNSFHYIEPWGDIGVFLGDFYVMGCCYYETGEEYAYEKAVAKIDAMGDDGAFELSAMYNDECFEDWRSEFIDDITAVLDMHNYSYFDPASDPYAVNLDCVEVNNTHIISVW